LLTLLLGHILCILFVNRGKVGVFLGLLLFSFVFFLDFNCSVVFFCAGFVSFCRFFVVARFVDLGANSTEAGLFSVFNEVISAHLVVEIVDIDCRPHRHIRLLPGKHGLPRFYHFLRSLFLFIIIIIKNNIENDRPYR